MLPSLIRYSALLPQVSGVFQPRPRFSGLSRRIVSVGQVPSFPRRSFIPPHIVREAFRPAQPVVRVPRQTFTTDNKIDSLAQGLDKLSITPARRATQTTSSDSSLAIIMASIGLAATIFLYNDSSQRHEELITSSFYEKEEDRQALIALLKNYASTISPQQLEDILDRLAQFSFRESSVLTDSHIEIVRLIMKELLANDSKKLLQLQQAEYDKYFPTPFGLVKSLARLTDARCKDLYDVIKDKVFKPTIERACVEVFEWEGTYGTSYDAYVNGFRRAESIGKDMAEFISESVKGNYSLCRDSVSHLFPKIVDYHQKNERDFKFSDMGYLCEAFCGILSREEQSSKEFLEIGATLLSLCEKKWSSEGNFSSTSCSRCVKMMRKQSRPSEFEALVSSLELATNLGIAKSEVVKRSEQFCSKLLEYDAWTHCSPSLFDRVICAFTKLGTDPLLIARLCQERDWMQSDYQKGLFAEDVLRKLSHSAAEAIVTRYVKNGVAERYKSSARMFTAAPSEGSFAIANADNMTLQIAQEIAEQKVMALTTALEDAIFQRIRKQHSWQCYPSERLSDCHPAGVLEKAVNVAGVDLSWQVPRHLFLELIPLASSRASKWLILLQTENGDPVEIYCE